MKQHSKILLLPLLMHFAIDLYAQTTDFADTAFIYFTETKSATKQHQGLWNKDLYAPLLLVNPQTRQVFASEPDSAGILKGTKEIYTGTLPKSINISNTSLYWSGKKWAMVMLPLSTNKNNRLNLLTHELFHRAQPSLGFRAYNPDNNHLDKKDGRVYLRLELEALKKANTAATAKEMREHIVNALVFRKYRNSLFPSSDSTENQLELNEGICEFTGAMMSGRNKREQQEQFIKRIDYFLNSPSYVRSFAYETTPVYGYLLSSVKKGWNKKINSNTNLIDFFSNEFDLKMPKNLKTASVNAAVLYNGDAIVKEEEVRSQKIVQQQAEYKLKFIDSPHVELPLIKMNMSFDYTRMVPLENYGTVYPSIRITDEWGILEAENGALISSAWNKVNISFPAVINGNNISGDGWKLELKEGYVIQLQNDGRGYVVKRQW